MSLYEQWKEIAYTEKTEEDYNKFWSDYLPKEKEVYEIILNNHTKVTEGKVSDLANEFNMEIITFIGFLDGINTSLTIELDLETITEDSSISLNIDFEKLYYNMHEAKADWLFNLSQWQNILDEKRRKEIKKEYNRSGMVINDDKIGRNEPCPCGSGKKYKKCCGK